MAKNETSPLISIITVNTNEKHRLVKYLPSVYASAGNFEVIISDNGSQDGSLEYIRDFFPQTRVIQNGANLGFAKANNIGARQARGDILVFLNPDTEVAPEWLTHLAKPFADAQVGLTTSKVLLMSDPSRINTCGNAIHLTGLTLCRGMGQLRNRFNQPEEVDAISGAAFAIRRELFEQLGGFSEDFFIYMEDTELSFKARLAGWSCWYVPESIVYHDYRLKFGPRKTLYQERNRYLMLLKCLRWRTLLALLPALLLAEVVTWGFVLRSDRANWRNKVEAYRWILANWKTIIQQRKAVQAMRKIGDRELLRRADYRLDFGQAATGWVAEAARRVFGPLFWFWRAAALAVVNW